MGPYLIGHVPVNTKTSRLLSRPVKHVEVTIYHYWDLQTEEWRGLMRMNRISSLH
jgi:hypothetical protein